MSEVIPGKPVPHGTHTGYARYRCRCEQCKTAGTAYYRAYYQRNRERILAATAARREATSARPKRHPPEHGTAAMHRKGCRCDPCRAAMAQYQREQREKHWPARRAAKAAHYAANRDAILARNRQWRIENPEFDRRRTVARSQDPQYRAKHAEYTRAWYVANRKRHLERTKANAAANPERRAAIARRWREAHPERAAESTRSWRQRNPDVVVAISARRRSRKRDNESCAILPRDWRRLCARYGGRCVYCREARPLTQDHVLPVVRGGRNAIGNLLPACKSCNSRKRHRTIMEWKLARLARGDEWRPMWLAS